MKPNEVVRALSALAQQSRLALFRLLVKRGPEGYTPGELQEKLSIAGSTLSFHLKSLQHAGLVQVRRDGRCLHYRVDFAAMHDLLDYLGEQCCSLSSTACDDNCRPLPGKARANRGEPSLNIRFNRK